MEFEIINSLFFKLLVLLTFIWVAGKLFRMMSLPVLFGELLAGIVVGPMVFNLVQPSETISVLSELGVFFLMLHAGLETEPTQIYQQSKKSIWIALAGFIIPFIGGYLVADIFGYDLKAKLFIALGLSITAIAIVARIFKENYLTKSPIYSQVMSAAIITDVLALIVFSVIISIIRHNTLDPALIAFIILKVIAFFTVILFIGHKFEKISKKIFKWGNKGFTLSLIFALAFGILAEIMGLHIIIGAFLAGLFIRENTMHEKIYNKIEDRIYGLSYGFLAPIFFINIAFYFNFNAFTENIYFLIALILVAILTKVIGCGGAALINKNSKVNSLMIGLAMNGRGAVDIVIAYEAYKLGFINEEVFSILVTMTLVTTFISIISIKWLRKHHPAKYLHHTI